MKVLLISSRYAPHATGGAERVTRTLAVALRDQGVDVRIVTTAVASREMDRVVDDIPVRVIPLRNVYDFSRAASAPLKPIWHAVDSFNPLMRVDVARILREERPSVVHTHVITGFSPSVWTAAADCGIPVVHTLHDHYVLCARSTMVLHGNVCQRQHLDCALFSLPRLRATRSVQAVVGVSDFILRRHLDYRAFPNSRYSVIPNSCHLVEPTISARADQGTRRQRSGPVRFGFLGRVESNKGIELLLDAVADLPGDWRLDVAGTGQEEYVRSLRVSHPSDRISFVGQVDPRAFLPKLDVLVCPSLVPETFGLSAAEALALGVPVVVSTRGALPELVSELRNGFLFDPSVPAALSEKLRYVVAHRRSVADMAPACVASTRAFEPGLVASAYRAVYESVM